MMRRPGSSDRMRALLDAHFMFIWRLLRRVGVPRNDLDDAVQQVFIVASGRLEDMADGSERSFLFGTALRVAASLRRSARRRSEVDGEALARHPDDRPWADEMLARRQRVASLDRIVRTLADELRTVFILCEIEELTVAEVAALQQIPIGTAASRLRRARRELERRAKHLRDGQPKRTNVTRRGCPARDLYFAMPSRVPLSHARAT